jgi:hypothetical protein
MNKTIPPKEGLGVAGGAKYLCQGIYFKLALDVQLNPSMWLYGGSAANDEKGLSLNFFFGSERTLDTFQKDEG